MFVQCTNLPRLWGILIANFPHVISLKNIHLVWLAVWKVPFNLKQPTVQASIFRLGKSHRCRTYMYLRQPDWFCSPSSPNTSHDDAYFCTLAHHRRMNLTVPYKNTHPRRHPSRTKDHWQNLNVNNIMDQSCKKDACQSFPNVESMKFYGQRSLFTCGEKKSSRGIPATSRVDLNQKLQKQSFLNRTHAVPPMWHPSNLN